MRAGRSYTRFVILLLATWQHSERLTRRAAGGAAFIPKVHPSERRRSVPAAVGTLGHWPPTRYTTAIFTTFRTYRKHRPYRCKKLSRNSMLRFEEKCAPTTTRSAGEDAAGSSAHECSWERRFMSRTNGCLIPYC